MLAIDNKRAYQVLERCQDLFPEWKKEHGRFWNSKTGEILTKDGIAMHDLVYRGDLDLEQPYLFTMEDLS